MPELPLSSILETISLESDSNGDSEVITEENGLALTSIAYMSGDGCLSVSINRTAEVQEVLSLRMQSVLDVIDRAETQAMAHRAGAPLERLLVHRTVKDLESAYAALRSLFLDLHRANVKAISRGRIRLSEQVTHKIHLLLWLDRSHYRKFGRMSVTGATTSEHYNLYNHLLRIEDPRTAYLWLGSGERILLDPDDPAEYMGSDAEVAEEQSSREQLYREFGPPPISFWAHYHRLASRKMDVMSEKEEEYKELFDELFIRDRVAQVRVHAIRPRAASYDRAKPDNIDWSHNPWGEDMCVGCGKKKKAWADRSRGICANCGRSLED